MWNTRSTRSRGGTALALAFAASAALAQEPPPPVTAPASPPAFQPGFLDALGRFLGDSKDKLDEQFKSTTDAAKSAAEAAGQATGAIIGLPGTRIVRGRERCPLAGNGAPDCSLGAEALCRAKGFGSGRHLEVSSRQSCRPRVKLADNPRVEANCATETFVVRAICQ
jgi:hypothetical protein